MRLLIDNALSPTLARRLREAGHDALAALLVANLPALADAFESGAIVVIEEDRLRVRPLPISP